MSEEIKRPPFKVSGNATIKHLNVRKEGPEDEKILAVDVKLEISQVDRRLCAYFDEALEAFLWRGDTNALIVRNMWLVPVVYGHEIKSANVQIEGIDFVGCEVKKFSIHPRDGGVMSLALSVSIYPSSNDVSQLARFVQDEVAVSIEGQPDLFDDVAPASTAAPLVADANDQDPMYTQALAVVLDNKKVSISLVQRHLKLGYNRAARLVEDMEKAGIVSAMNPSGQRSILKTKESATA